MKERNGLTGYDGVSELVVGHGGVEVGGLDGADDLPRRQVLIHEKVVVAVVEHRSFVVGPDGWIDGRMDGWTDGRKEWEELMFVFFFRRTIIYLRTIAHHCSLNNTDAKP